LDTSQGLAASLLTNNRYQKYTNTGEKIIDESNLSQSASNDDIMSVEESELLVEADDFLQRLPVSNTRRKSLMLLDKVYITSTALLQGNRECRVKEKVNKTISKF